MITLIASDFDSLDELSYDTYLDNHDCPVFRALKRIGVPVKWVGSERYVAEDDSLTMFKGSYHELQRCRRELLAGATEAYIQEL